MTKLIILLSTLFLFSDLKAQDSIGEYHEGHPWCKYNPATDHASGITKSIPTGTLPQNSQILCGVIRVTFMDVYNDSDIGFDDPILGETRRNCVCNALNYIQNVIVFPSSISTNTPLEILLMPSLNTTLDQRLGYATTIFSPNFYSMIPGYYGGHVFDFITTGINPALSNEEHGQITMNFGHQFSYCTPSIGNCEYDFESVIIHEFTHLLGMGSLIKENTSLQLQSAWAPNVFTQWDNFYLYYLDAGNTFNKIVDINTFSSNGGINPALPTNMFADYTTAERVWIDSSPLGNRTNNPVHSRINGYVQGTTLSHLDEHYLWRTSFSPSFSPNYVMNGYFNKHTIKNILTKQELHVLDGLGYTINIGNVPDYTNSPPSLSGNVLIPTLPGYPESPIPASNSNLHIVTTNCNPVVINLSTNNISNGSINHSLGFYDLDGDPIQIFDGEVFNLRGCGSGGNNNNQLTISSGNDIITFTPRTNFVGRAQFAFHLYDGIDRGSYVVITIDVNPDACFNNGTEHVINGSFEEGQMVRTLTELDNNLTSDGIDVSDHYSYNTFCDGQEYYNYAWQDQHIRNSYVPCLFGDVYYSFPSPGLAPLPLGNSGDRFTHFASIESFHQRLSPPLLNCHNYIMEMDLSFSTPFLPVGTIVTFPVAIRNGILGTNLFSSSITLTHTGNGDWHHITIPLPYTSSLLGNYFFIDPNSFNSCLIDNLTIKDDSNFPGNFPIVSINPLNPTLCSGETINLTASGALNYSWSPITGLSNYTSNSVNASPSNTMTYTIIGTDEFGCQGSTTETISVLNTSVNINASLNTVCPGQSTLLTASGADTYSWVPSIDLSATTGSSVFANPTSTATYTVTGTSVEGCTSSTDISITVDNSINLAITSPDVMLCPGETTTLEATGAVDFTWNPGSLNSNPITITPINNTIYTVTGTSTFGCTATESITVNVDNSLNDFSVTASQNTLCQGQTSILTASGADSYSWSPASGLSATTGDVVTANPSTTTTYMVTGTSIDGCTTSTEITIIVDDAINLTITVSDENLCPGESSTLEASGAVNYTWDPGSLTSNPITVSPSSSTTYTVTGTSAFGCTATTSVNVTVDNSITNVSVLASEDIVCPGGLSILTASGANTYTWEPDNFSGNPYSVNPTVTTTYTVTGTSLSGCTASTDVTVSVSDNPNTFCCLAATLTLYDDQTSTSIGTIPNNSVINVNGVFTVNTNLALVQCTLRMAPNARIEVLSGSTFVLTDCLIFSCTEMWDGIYSNPGAMLTIEGSRIEDAKNAVFSFQGGNYYLNSSTFNKNNISLLVNPINTPHPGIVKNCIFDCTDQNSPTVGNVLKAPMAGEKSHFGIYCEKVEQISFGVISAQPNIFRNLEIGIHIRSSNANIYRNDFNSITEPFCAPVFPATCPVIGWAIWAQESKLLIGDNAGASHENNIRDCSNGIFLDGFCKYEIRKNNFTNINTPTFKGQYSKCIFARFGYINILPSIGEIEDNTFINFECGIYYEANQMTYLKINRNRFAGFNTPNGTAIYLRQNSTHPIEIKNNVINNTPPFKGWYGIRVQNAVQSSSNVTIEQNTIKNVKHAIWATKSDGINISDHNADFTSIGATPAGIYYPNALPTSFSVGIKVEDSPNTNISNNLIQKAAQNPTAGYTNLLYGISVEMNGMGSTIIENEVKRLGKGLNFYGQTNAPLYVSCNAMNLNRTGLSLNNTYIGDQGASFPAVAQDNQWTIPVTGTGWLGVDRSLSSSSGIWYTRSSSLPFFPMASQMIPVATALLGSVVSGAPYNCSFGCANPPCLMVDGGKMIKKENPFNLLNNEEKQMIDIQMYKLLKNNPSYLTSGTPDDSIYVSYVDSLENTNIGKIYRFSKQLELGDTTASYNEILSVNPIFTAETNHKIVNEIYWRSWVHNIFEFSPADSAYLLSVAEQHPHQGGTAVYDARVMLGLDFYDYDEDDQQKSTTIEEEEISVFDEQGEIKFVLYPNPANSYINYRASLIDQENAELVIYDVLGKPIVKQLISKENLEGIIDIQEMASGLYTYRIFINKESIKTGTFIVN